MLRLQRKTVSCGEREGDTKLVGGDGSARENMDPIGFASVFGLNSSLLTSDYHIHARDTTWEVALKQLAKTANVVGKHEQL